MGHTELVQFIESHKKANLRKEENTTRFGYFDIRDRFYLLTFGQDRFLGGCWDCNINEYYFRGYDFEKIIHSLVAQRAADLDFKSVHVHEKGFHEHTAPQADYKHESVGMGSVAGRLRLEGELLRIESLAFIPAGRYKEWHQKEAPIKCHKDEIMGAVARHLNEN